MIFYFPFIFTIIALILFDLNIVGTIITYFVLIILAVVIESIREKRNIVWEVNNFLCEWWEHAKNGIIFLIILAIIGFAIGH